MVKLHPHIRILALSLLMALTALSLNAEAPIIDSINSPESTVRVRIPAKLSARLTPAQTPVAAEPVATVDTPAPASSDPESSTDLNVSTVKQPGRAQHAGTRTVGYRVQVYSDNNQRTARQEAEKRAGAIRAHFPDYQVYVVFQSPYWRVKVGNFRSRSQAEDAASRMRGTLPAYGKEMRVVKDHITVGE